MRTKKNFSKSDREPLIRSIKKMCSVSRARQTPKDQIHQYGFRQEHSIVKSSKVIASLDKSEAITKKKKIKTSKVGVPEPATLPHYVVE